MFTQRRSKLICTLLTFLFVLHLNAPVVHARDSAAVNACADRVWTEKERIGSDVPLEAWRDSRMTPWAALLCIHGLGLHSNSYTDFGKRMAQLGVATYALDVRGFGSWQNTEENKTVDFGAALDDVRSALVAVHKAHPKLPVVLLGESMGGALAIQATALNPTLVDGLISSVPSGVRHSQKLTNVKVAVGLLSAPNKPMSIGKKMVHQATQNEELRENWQKDPSARMTLSPKELVHFQTFMNQNLVRAKQIESIPVLFVQGGSDRLVKIKGNVDLFKSINSKDKDLVVLGSSEHLIFEEDQFDQHVLDVVASWIEKHVSEPYLTKGEPADKSKQEIEHNQALGRLLLAQGYIKLEDYANALDQLKQVMVLGRGSRLAQDAQNLMLGLPTSFLAPKVGPETIAQADQIKFISHEGAMANDKPTVLVFCADWVGPCHSVAGALKDLYAEYGNEINFVHIDADAPDSQTLVQKYGIGPLPAILYLNATNQVMSYTLGFTAQAEIRKEILKLMSSTTAQAP